MDLKPTENRENYMHCHTCRKSVKSGRKNEKWRKEELYGRAISCCDLYPQIVLCDLDNH